MRRITREQAAAALAVAAVACLSSVIIHWSQATPVREPAWQHPLFGDLSDGAPSVASQPVASQAAAPQAVAPQPITTQPNSQVDSAGTSGHGLSRPTDLVRKPPLRKVDQQNPPESRTDALSPPVVKLVRFTEPDAAGSERVRVAGYESRAVTEAAWLSGAIEEEAVGAAAAPAASSSQIRLGEPVSADD